MFELLGSRAAIFALRIFMVALAVAGALSLGPGRAVAADPNAIDEDDDGHYERLPMEPANVKTVFLGFRLTTIEPGSIYERAGLRSGDLLKSMNGKAVVEPDDLKELPKILDRDKKVELKIERGDKRMTLRYSVQVVKKTVPAKKVALKKAAPTKSPTAKKSVASKKNPAKKAASENTPAKRAVAKKAAVKKVAVKSEQANAKGKPVKRGSTAKKKSKPVEKQKPKVKTAEIDPSVPSEASMELEAGPELEKESI